MKIIVNNNTLIQWWVSTCPTDIFLGLVPKHQSRSEFKFVKKQMCVQLKVRGNGFAKHSNLCLFCFKKRSRRPQKALGKVFFLPEQSSNKISFPNQQQQHSKWRTQHHNSLFHSIHYWDSRNNRETRKTRQKKGTLHWSHSQTTTHK